MSGTRPCPHGWFITGTDTEVGKTTVAAALLWSLARAGHACTGMKPIATGCSETAAGLSSPDAEQLRAAGSIAAPLADASPYRFAPSVAPHLAAQAAGTPIELERIRAHFVRLGTVASWVVVEGVGGWLVPLGGGSTVADLARWLQLPVILVVGMRLGCLNHALLTVASVHQTGVALAGWVANQIDPGMALLGENIDALRQRIDAPLLGVVPYLARGHSPAEIAPHLDIAQLLFAAGEARDG